MQETPSLRKLYEDDEGLCYVHIIEDGKLVIHSHFKIDKTKDSVKKAREISDMIDQAFRDKGIQYLHTWATNPEEERYNEFLGYKPTGYEVTINGEKQDPPIYEYYKEL